MRRREADSRPTEQSARPAHPTDPPYFVIRSRIAVPVLLAYIDDIARLMRPWNQGLTVPPRRSRRAVCARGHGPVTTGLFRGVGTPNRNSVARHLGAGGRDQPDWLMGPTRPLRRPSYTACFRGTPATNRAEGDFSGSDVRVSRNSVVILSTGTRQPHAVRYDPLAFLVGRPSRPALRDLRSRCSRGQAADCRRLITRRPLVAHRTSVVEPASAGGVLGVDGSHAD